MYCGGLRFDRLITSTGVALAAGGDPKVFVRTMIDLFVGICRFPRQFQSGKRFSPQIVGEMLGIKIG